MLILMNFKIYNHDNNVLNVMFFHKHLFYFCQQTKKNKCKYNHA